jgi:dTDP-4-dehydrorhamnose reductase
MKILVTGANGFLGQHLTLFLEDNKIDVAACGRGECRIPVSSVPFHSIDLTNYKAVCDLIETATPDVIIHTAAMSKPDHCEQNKCDALLHNVNATRHLLEAFRKQNSTGHFIFTSSDFIFGDDGPHAEEHDPSPLNYYGETKLLAEEEVRNSGLHYTIVRPVFIYGKHWEGVRPSFIHWVKNNLEAGNKIKVVSDQRRTPTFVKDICNGISSIINIKASGTYHIAGSEVLSPYEMAVATANFLNLDASLIEEVSADSFPEPVQRAKKSGLRIEKAMNELGFSPTSFRDGLRLSFE